MMRRVFTSVTLGIVALAWAASAGAQSAHRIEKKTYGCQSEEMFGKIVGYSASRDNVAFKKALGAGLANGQCDIFDVGESVELTDTSIFTGKVKIRRRGDVVEYWTFIEHVK
ncbi:hypothetical protein [Ralstonia soli]|uniref:Uncharacterized protein n=1 Tax=Ralstonia soli TaxID=2953896 RepID=A0ABT1AIW5_9RALS|nr:hypothetical protein [Ralstonia soli]MCO5398335.1 hypothetical protein [Ralstonia soli]